MFTMYKMDFGDTSNIRTISPLKEFEIRDLVFSIRIYYSNVDESLYMNVYDQYDDVIANGIRLTQGIDLFAKISHKFERKFSVMIIGKNDYIGDVTADNFGNEMVMYYAENV